MIIFYMDWWDRRIDRIDKIERIERSKGVPSSRGSDKGEDWLAMLLPMIRMVWWDRKPEDIFEYYTRPTSNIFLRTNYLPEYVNGCLRIHSFIYWWWCNICLQIRAWGFPILFTVHYFHEDLIHHANHSLYHDTDRYSLFVPEDLLFMSGYLLFYCQCIICIRIYYSCLTILHLAEVS